MNVQQFQERLFTKGHDLGFTDMELYYEREEKFSCGVFKGEIDKYESSEIAGISFRGIYNGKMGYAFTEKLDDESVHYLLEHAKENSLIIEDEDKEEIFAGSKEYREENFYSDNLSRVTPEDKINVMLEIEKEIYAYDERVKATDYFILSSSEAEKAISNNKGLFLQDKTNSLGFYVSVVVKQGEEIKTGSYVKVTKDFSSIDPKQVAKQAVEEALSQLNAQSIASKKYPVLLRHDAAASLIQTFIPVFSAENTQKGQSRLKGKVGETIGVSSLNIVDDPFLPNGLLSRNFDGEGVATKTLQLVSNGVLTTFLHNRKTAAKDGVESTGHAHKSSYKSSITVSPSNLYIEPTSKSYNELVTTIDEGIIITDLSGLHSGANQISGDFSLAANGYYVKGGKIVTAVNQMTIAGNFYELLNSITEIGSDLDFTPWATNGFVGSPSLLVQELSVTVE
ncbi:TldD/PmbA family protein [Bacillus salitolerans]|uniref:TldD/PmbA family protein n=1 Tax=Bacillus salitolerans TaxID=1437434 RepID=A0ABW4LM03_9BACI